MNQTTARLTGIIYLVLIAAGIYATVFIRSNLIDPNNLAATTTNLLASEGLFRLSIASDLVMIVADVALALLFYILFRPVNQALSLFTAFFRLIQAAILATNLLNLFLAWEFLTPAVLPETESPLNGLFMAFLNAQSIGYDLGLIFFAVSLGTLAYLLYQSRYVPRLIAILLALSAGVYLVGSLITVLMPDLRTLTEAAYLLPFVAESALALWMSIKGVNQRRQQKHSQGFSHLHPSTQA